MVGLHQRRYALCVGVIRAVFMTVALIKIMLCALVGYGRWLSRSLERIGEELEKCL